MDILYRGSITYNTKREGQTDRERKREIKGGGGE